MEHEAGTLEALIQQKLDSDTEFQASLESMEEVEREEAIVAKRNELINIEYNSALEKAKKAEEIARNQEIRAKKAEGAAKLPKTETSTPKKEEISRKEQILESRALNSLHEDDIDEVIAIAEAKGMTYSQAVKDPYIKSFLKVREEERKTAEATQSKGTNFRSNSKEAKTDVIKRVDSYGLKQDEMRDAAKAMIDEVFGKK